MSVFWVAEQFGKLVHEVEESLTSDELAEYLAYFKVKNEEQAKENKKAAKASKSSGRGKRKR